MSRAGSPLDAEQPAGGACDPVLAELRRLSAFEEIRQLAFSYAHAFATHDRALMLSLWARADRREHMPTIDGHRIRRDLQRWWQELGLCLLHVTNHLIDLESEDRARGEVHCLGQIEVGQEWVDQTILYKDVYVRQDGRWLFASREHRLWYGQSRERHPLRQPPASWPHGQVGSGDLPGAERRV